MMAAFAACVMEESLGAQEILASTSQALSAPDFGFAWSNQLTGTFTPSTGYDANTGDVSPPGNPTGRGGREAPVLGYSGRTATVSV